MGNQSDPTNNLSNTDKTAQTSDLNFDEPQSAMMPNVTKVKCSDYSKNPGTYEDLFKIFKDVTPMCFDGARMSVNRSLSSHFLLTHNMTMGSSPSFKFGASYVGTNQYQQSEIFPMMIGEMSLNGDATASVIHQWNEHCRSKFVMQTEKDSLAGIQMSTDYRTLNSTSSFHCVNIDPIKRQGILILSYLQKVTARLSLGTEYMYQFGKQIPSGSVGITSFGGKYTAPDWSTMASVSQNGILHLGYTCKRPKNPLQFAVEMETNLQSMQSITTCSYQVDLSKAHCTFKAFADSDWNVGATMEKQLHPMPFTFILSGMVNNVKQAFKFGIGLMLYAFDFDIIREDIKEMYVQQPLSQIRKRLLSVQSKLSTFDIEEWRRLTNKMDKCSQTGFFLKKLKVEMPTRAWLKMYEILFAFPQLTDFNENFRSLHLCEAPGAFICALNHFLTQRDKQDSWDWVANSLNPRYEWNDPKSTITSDCRLIDSYPDKWVFGNDNSGSILNEENKKLMIDQWKNKFNLVTADGGIDCHETPELQEEMTLPLIEAELDIALESLTIHGCLILKAFSMFTEKMNRLVFRLIDNFKEVSVIKPTSSRCGNSERYYVCIDKCEMYRSDQLKEDIQTKLEYVQEKLVSEQIMTIEYNLERHKCEFDPELPDREEYNKVFSQMFVDSLKIEPINFFLKKKFKVTTQKPSIDDSLMNMCFPNGKFCNHFNLNCSTKCPELKPQLGIRLNKLPTISPFLDQKLLDMVNIISPKQCTIHSDNDLFGRKVVQHFLDRRTVDSLYMLMSSSENVTVNLICTQGCMEVIFEETEKTNEIMNIIQSLDKNALQLFRYPLNKSFVESIKGINAMWAWTILNAHY